MHFRPQFEVLRRQPYRHFQINAYELAADVGGTTEKSCSQKIKVKANSVAYGSENAMFLLD